MSFYGQSSGWDAIITAEDNRLRAAGIPFESTSYISPWYQAFGASDIAFQHRGIDRLSSTQFMNHAMGMNMFSTNRSSSQLCPAEQDAELARIGAASCAAVHGDRLGSGLRSLAVTYVEPAYHPIFGGFGFQHVVRPAKHFGYGSQFVSYNPADETAFDFKDPNKTLINTEAKLRVFLPKLLQLEQSHQDRPEIAIDSEGYNLGRDGTLTTLQMHFRSFRHTYVFDVKRLGGCAFFDIMEQGVSFRNVIGSTKNLHVGWDIRQDCDALNHHFGVQIGWAVDLQLVELVARPRYKAKDRVISLSECISKHGPNFLGERELNEWLQLNAQGKQYFREVGYKVFDNRPLKELAWEYAADDVHLTLNLFDHLWGKLSQDMKDLVRRETKRRMDESVSHNKPRGSNVAPGAFWDLE